MFVQIKAGMMNITAWKSSSQICHLLNLRSCGEILLNWRNSMTATSTGWTSLAMRENPGSTEVESEGAKCSKR